MYISLFMYITNTSRFSQVRHAVGSGRGNRRVPRAVLHLLRGVQALQEEAEEEEEGCRRGGGQEEEECCLQRCGASAWTRRLSR
jgi:hypothetical protein